MAPGFRPCRLPPWMHVAWHQAAKGTSARYLTGMLPYGCVSFVLRTLHIAEVGVLSAGLLTSSRLRAVPRTTLSLSTCMASGPSSGSGYLQTKPPSRYRTSDRYPDRIRRAALDSGAGSVGIRRGQSRVRACTAGTLCSLRMTNLRGLMCRCPACWPQVGRLLV